MPNPKMIYPYISREPHTFKRGRVELVQVYHWKCVTCGQVNRRLLVLITKSHFPQYCNRKCFDDRAGAELPRQRAIEAYRYYMSEEQPTLQETAKMLGVTTRERARQLVNKGEAILKKRRDSGLE